MTLAKHGAIESLVLKMRMHFRTRDHVIFQFRMDFVADLFSLVGFFVYRLASGFALVRQQHWCSGRRRDEFFEQLMVKFRVIIHARVITERLAFPSCRVLANVVDLTRDGLIQHVQGFGQPQVRLVLDFGQDGFYDGRFPMSVLAIESREIVLQRRVVMMIVVVIITGSHQARLDFF